MPKQKLHQKRKPKKSQIISTKQERRCINKGKSYQHRFQVNIKPFWEHDVERIIKNGPDFTNNKTVCRAYFHIHDFIDTVFDDFELLYPDIYKNKPYVRRLFERILNER